MKLKNNLNQNQNLNKNNTIAVVAVAVLNVNAVNLDKNQVAKHFVVAVPWLSECG